MERRYVIKGLIIFLLHQINFSKNNFLEKQMLLFWKEIIVRIRSYIDAKITYEK